MLTIPRFSDTITEEQYCKLTRLDYERKPDQPSDVHSSINFGELDESIREIVAGLPVVEFPGSFFDSFLSGEQQFYLVTYKDKVYLVDTQGYTYARYVIQLKDLVVLGKEESDETMLMKAHPGSVETIIDILKHMEVDGETMEYIIRKVGMEDQMLRQLFLKADKDVLWDLQWRTRMFNYYDYINYYGNRMFAIAGVNAMPARFNSILFTGTYEECMQRLNPVGLEGSFEDFEKKVAIPK